MGKIKGSLMMVSYKVHKTDFTFLLRLFNYVIETPINKNNINVTL